MAPLRGARSKNDDPRTGVGAKRITNTRHHRKEPPMQSIYDLKTRENMIIYHSLKERFDYRMSGRQDFILITAKILKEKIRDYDCLIIPESSNNFLEEIVKATDKKYIIIHKTSINHIIQNIDTLGLQKKEKQCHLEKIASMDGVFKVKLLKANQRRKYTNLIFEQQTAPPNSIIVDDSLFSGTTMESLKYATGCNDYIAIFSK